MKNTHLKQLINPDKIFRMLQKLKESGSPYHQDLLTPEEFKNQCQRDDRIGYQALYSDEEDSEDCIDEVHESIEDEASMRRDSNPKLKENEATQDKLEDGEDPVKKYHFTYDESLCMMNNRLDQKTRIFKYDFWHLGSHYIGIK